MIYKMKPLLFLTFLASSAWAGSFVYESDSRFTASGDINGDGQADAIIVERSSGAYTIGIYNAGSGALTFTPALPSGIPNPTGIAVGNFDDPARDSLAVTSPSSNRVHIIEPLSSVFNAPRAVYSAGDGPFNLAPVDIVGVGTAGLEDVIALNHYVSLTGNTQVRSLKNTAGALSIHSVSSITGQKNDSLNPVNLKRGTNGFTAYFDRDSFNDFYRFPNAFSSTPLASGSQCAFGHFDALASDFFFYEPGQSSKATVQRVDTATPSFYAPSLLDFGATVRQILTLPDAANDRLLVIFDDGTAGVYDYTQAGGITLADAMAAAPAGTTNAIPLDDGLFTLMQGSAYQVYKLSGGSYGMISQGTLPDQAAFTRASSGNVFFFDGTPFIDEMPVLLGQQRLSDWTTSINLAGGDATVTSKEFLDSVTGLGGGVTQNLGQAFAGTTSGLVNQHMPDISLASVSPDPPVLGEASAIVNIFPPSGQYSASVKVTIESSESVFYRTSSTQPFQNYANPFYLFQNATVEAYSRDASNRLSPVVSAIYTLTSPPEKQDSDGDGVPDFVEVVNGFDPEGGPDDDGDGVSDLNELLNGATRPDTAAQLTLNVTPHPFDPVPDAPGSIANGAELRAYSVKGGLLGYGTSNNGSATLVSNPVDPSLRFLVVATTPHFPVQTIQVDKNVGREIVALVPVPDSPAIVPDFSYNENPGNQALLWIAAAQTAYSDAVPSVLAVDLTIYDTLVLALVEARIGKMLSIDRLVIPSASHLSMTPFRVSEIGGPLQLASVTPQDLVNLEKPAPLSDPLLTPAVLVRPLHQSYKTAIVNSGNVAGVTALKNIIADIYRITAELNNGSPATFRLPLDVIREMAVAAASGPPSLPAEYVPHLSYNQATRDLAMSTLSQLLDGSSLTPQNRSLVTHNLEIPTGVGPEGCTLADAIGSGGSTYSLRDHDGDAFEYPEAFTLLPGSRIRVVAYNDLADHCGHPALEVISISLLTVPISTPSDTDGNLLPDTWERFFFGDTGQDPLTSPDGSGYSLLQQFLEGTDPTDPTSFPAVPPVELILSNASLEFDENTSSLIVNWDWPNEYAEFFEFGIIESSDLSVFDETIFTLASEGNSYSGTISDNAADRRFFKVFVRLKQNP